MMPDKKKKGKFACDKCDKTFRRQDVLVLYILKQLIWEKVFLATNVLKCLVHFIIQKPT